MFSLYVIQAQFKLHYMSLCCEVNVSVPLTVFDHASAMLVDGDGTSSLP